MFYNVSIKTYKNIPKFKNALRLQILVTKNQYVFVYDRLKLFK